MPSRKASTTRCGSCGRRYEVVSQAQEVAGTLVRRTARWILERCCTQAGHWRERLPGFARDSLVRLARRKAEGGATRQHRASTIYRSRFHGVRLRRTATVAQAMAGCTTTSTTVWSTPLDARSSLHFAPMARPAQRPRCQYGAPARQLAATLGRRRDTWRPKDQWIPRKIATCDPGWRPKSGAAIRARRRVCHRHVCVSTAY